MRVVRWFTVACLAFLFSCQSGEECHLPPCVPPNINEVIKLTLHFPNLPTGEEIELVRISKSDKSVIDTLQFELSADKEIYIGGRGPVGFTESNTGELFVDEILDFDIFHLREPINKISDIKIVAILPDCGCVDYKISTIQLDGETIEVNSSHYTLNL